MLLLINDFNIVSYIIGWPIYTIDKVNLSRTS